MSARTPSRFAAALVAASLCPFAATATEYAQTYAQNQAVSGGVTNESDVSTFVPTSGAGVAVAASAPVNQVFGTDFVTSQANAAVAPFGGALQAVTHAQVAVGDNVTLLGSVTATLRIDRTASAAGNLFFGGVLNTAEIYQDPALGGAAGLQNGGYSQSVSLIFHAYVDNVQVEQFYFASNNTPNLNVFNYAFGSLAPVNANSAIEIDMTLAAAVSINGALIPDASYTNAYADPPSFELTIGSDTPGLQLVSSSGAPAIDTVPIPEPASAVLMVAGLLSLAGLRRRD